MDVASLGLEVRSESVRKGTEDLNRFNTAAQKADSTSRGLAESSKATSAAAAAVSSGARNATTALNAESAAATQATNALSLHARAANQNVRSLGGAGGNIANLSAQLQDVAVSAQMGMGALQIGLQQGVQLASVFAAMDNPVRGLGEAFLSVLSPVSILTIALTALAAVGIQNVNWGGAASSVLSMLADSLETIAPLAVGAAAALALIYAPAIVTGMVAMIALLARMSVAALATAASFTTAWLAAIGPVGAVIAGITAVLGVVYVFRDEVKAALGVDIMEVAKTGANYILNSFEAAYADIQFLWSNFGNVIGAAVTEAVNAAILSVNELIKQSAAGLDWLIAKANQIPGVNIAPIGNPGDLLKTWENDYAANLEKAATGRNANLERIMGQDRIGQFGTAIAEGASSAAEKVRDLAGWMGTVEEEAAKKGGKTEAEKFSDITNAADRTIAGLLAERDAMGLTQEAAAALRHEQSLFNEAQQKGIELTPKQANYLSALGETMAELESAIAAARLEQDLLFERAQLGRSPTEQVVHSRLRGAGIDITSAQGAALAEQIRLNEEIKTGEQAWTKFGQRAEDILLGLVDGTMTWRDALKAALPAVKDLVLSLMGVNNAGGSGGGFGGLLSSIFGGLLGGGMSPMATSAINAGTAFTYAKGTNFHPGGPARINELGGEILDLPRGSRVIPHDVSMRMAATGNRPPAYNDNRTITIDARGAQQGVGEEIRAALEAYDRTMPQRLGTAMPEAMRRGYLR
ncbi:MAG TPA: phage tail length tape measure family protein [Mesorhizobium sp.]|jgi:hypothetical protein|nr:phage tail length tape measure family protein [Mesorhizobium sp.]